MSDVHEPDHVAEAKAALRERLLAARRARTPGDLAAARRAVADVVLARAAARGWRRVAAYEPLRTEPGSVDLLQRLADSGVQVLVPITLADRDLDWEPWPARGALGVAAVGGVDAVLVPALAVAAGGARLGRGGGSYDRALLRCPSAERVALVFEGEIVASLPVDTHDQPVDAAATPTGVHALRNTAVGPDI
jgi:5-formyltetrahydrofolate cyclo-ligase